MIAQPHHPSQKPETTGRTMEGWMRTTKRYAVRNVTADASAE